MAGIEDIIPSSRTTLMCGSNKDQRGCYLAIPTTGSCYTIPKFVQCVFHAMFVRVRVSLTSNQNTRSNTPCTHSAAATPFTH